jgi:hypothetical protein
MRAFEVKQGTVGVVYFPRPSRERRYNFSVRQDLMFDREEMIFDPVSYANKALADVSRWCRSQAKKGLAGFRRDGYLLVVKYSDVNVI